jgi:hypothetical protein
VDLALKDAHLVAEDQELDVLVSVAPAARDCERQDPAQPEVQEREGHRSMMTGTCANCQLKALIEIVVPFSSPSMASRPVPVFWTVKAKSACWPAATFPKLSGLGAILSPRVPASTAPPGERMVSMTF